MNASFQKEHKILKILEGKSIQIYQWTRYSNISIDIVEDGKKENLMFFK